MKNKKRLSSDLSLNQVDKPEELDGKSKQVSDKVNGVHANDQVEEMSYEESLNELDLVLSELQKENISVEDLKSLYLKGKAYLKHCEALLEKIEQDVIELEPKN